MLHVSRRISIPFFRSTNTTSTWTCLEPTRYIRYVVTSAFGTFPMTSFLHLGRVSLHTLPLFLDSGILLGMPRVCILRTEINCVVYQGGRTPSPLLTSSQKRRRSGWVRFAVQVTLLLNLLYSWLETIWISTLANTCQKATIHRISLLFDMTCV